MRRKTSISMFIILLCAPEALADVVVIVRREAESAGKYIRVCDIARVEGPRELALEVAKTVIGPTPQRGETREITRWEIEKRLREMGLDADIAFAGNDSVTVFGNGMPGPAGKTAAQRDAPG